MGETARAEVEPGRGGAKHCRRGPEAAVSAEGERKFCLWESQ